MPEDILLHEVLPLLHNLTAELPAIEARLSDKMDAYDRRLNRHRKAMRLTVAVMVLGVSIVAAIGTITIRDINRSNERAQRANEFAQRVACESGNQVRVNFLAFIDQILAQAPLPPNPTAEQVAAFGRRQSYVAQARAGFMPLKCG